MRRRTMMTPQRPTKMRIWWKRDKAVRTSVPFFQETQDVHYRLELDAPTNDTVIWNTTIRQYRSDKGGYNYTSQTSAPMSPDEEMTTSVNPYWGDSVTGLYTMVDQITIQAKILGATATKIVTISRGNSDVDWKCGDWVEIVGGGKLLTLNILPQEGLPYAA